MSLPVDEGYLQIIMGLCVRNIAGLLNLRLSAGSLLGSLYSLWNIPLPPSIPSRKAPRMPRAASGQSHYAAGIEVWPRPPNTTHRKTGVYIKQERKDNASCRGRADPTLPSPLVCHDRETQVDVGRVAGSVRLVEYGTPTHQEPRGATP